MISSVTVLTKPQCQQCLATKLKLTNEGIPFAMLDVTTDQYAMDLALSTGITNMPIVIVDYADGDMTSWGGYSPDKIEKLKGEFE